MYTRKSVWYIRYIRAAWQYYYKGLLLGKHTDGTMIHADKYGLAINASGKMRFISSSRYQAWLAFEIVTTFGNYNIRYIYALNIWIRVRSTIPKDVKIAFSNVEAVIRMYRNVFSKYIKCLQ